MDVERCLLTKVIDTGEIRPVIDARITTDFFEDDDSATVYEWMLDHWQNYSKVPGDKTLKANFPNFKLIEADEPLTFYIDAMVQARANGIVLDTISQANKLQKNGDYTAAKAALFTGVELLSREVTPLHDIDVTLTVEERIEEYRSYTELKGGLRGVPTGYKTIDRATLGLQPEQLVTLIALPKRGKSTVVMQIAMAVQDYGCRVLVISFEMSAREQYQRYDAWRAGVSYNKLMSGRLTPKETKQLHRTMRENAEKMSFIISADISASTTVSGVASKVAEHKPNLVVVDGAYLMEAEGIQADPGSPQALTSITRGLKRLAQREKVPIVITTQVLPSKYKRRDGITADAIGYTSSFAQDSDVILGLEETDSDEVIKLKIVEARNARRAEALIRFSWDTGDFEEMEDDPNAYATDGV